MTMIATTANTIVSAPPTATASRGVSSAATTLSGMPTSAPTYPHCSPRAKTRPTEAAPTSSVIHACSAPLWNVQPMPQIAQPSRTTGTDATDAATRRPTPNTNQPMMIDSRRLYVSATTPVGTSNRKTATSITVPTSTSSSGFMPTSRTKYTPLTVKATANASEIHSSLA
jgi:hypothetical protein